MKRVSSKKAAAILDFLARRAGYDYASLSHMWHPNSLGAMVFYEKTACGINAASNKYAYLAASPVAIEHDSNKYAMQFDLGASVASALKEMLKDASHIYVKRGPHLESGDEDACYVTVFKEGECLESLAVKTDLEDSHV